MARPGRFLVPHQPQHVIQRGNNRGPVFFGDGDHAFYLECLRDACRQHGCSVHAYVLMTNHVHLLISPHTAPALPRAMQAVGRRYTRYVNWRNERSGTLWEGRYRAAPIDSDRYFMACSRYIELNPVRAGMVVHPGEYAWSSFAANAGGAADPIVTPHDLYQSLGASSAERCAAYLDLFDQQVDAGTLARIREATQAGWPLGGEQFVERIARTVCRRATPLPRGPRPRAT